MHLARLEADRPLLELRGDVALGVDLDEQHALADVRRRAARSRRPSCSCRRRPCPVKKSRRRSSRSGAGPITAAPLPAAEADLASPASPAISTYASLSVGTPTCRPFVSVSQSMRVVAAERVLDGLASTCVGRLVDLERRARAACRRLRCVLPWPRTLPARSSAHDDLELGAVDALRRELDVEALGDRAEHDRRLVVGVRDDDRPARRRRPRAARARAAPGRAAAPRGRRRAPAPPPSPNSAVRARRGRTRNHDMFSITPIDLRG